jgi:hypothetical protein
MPEKTFMSNSASPSFAELSAKPSTVAIPTTISINPGPKTFSTASANPNNNEPKNDMLFGHDTKNTTQNASEVFNINFKPNVLDSYDVYTYHWKLFITPLSAATSGKVLNYNQQTVIVESGVSDLTIDRIEINGVAVPSIQAGTGTQTTLKFEIFEPGSAELLDKMFYEATALGMGNWFVMPCFLQLEFRGRTPEDSNTVNSGIGGPLADLKWVWPIKISNCKANVNETGTKYSFEAIFYNELAQTNPYFSVQHSVTLDGLTTFEKAMDLLEDKLNVDQYEKLMDNYSIPDTYKIIVDDKLKNIQLVSPEFNTATRRNSDFINLNQKMATFNTGTGIDKIVDSLLMSTKYFQEKIQGSTTPSSTPGTANTVQNQMKKLWRVVTETKPIAFDPLRQDNAVEITVYIVEYDIGAIDVIAAQTGQTVDTRTATVKRVNEYLEKKILNKIYNYIFTGLNDQIINFDLNLNFSFAAALSRFSGIYIDSNTQTTGIVAQRNPENEKKVAEQIRKTIQFVNNAKDEKQIRERVETARLALQQSTLPDEDKQRYTILLNNARPTSRRAFTQEIQRTGGINTAGNLNREYSTSLSLAKSASTDSNIVPRFISDVQINTPAARQAYEKAIANRKGKLRPIPFRETNQEVNASNNIDPDANAGRARLASVFSTALYSTLDASLQMIKLTIKGDPFWLYPKPIQAGITSLTYKSTLAPQDAIKMIKSEHILNNGDILNVYGTDNFIVLRLRAPRIYENLPDTVDPYTEIETFSGVYRVIEVVSRFENGMFTQELSCNLDPMINLRDLPEFLQQIERSLQTNNASVASVNNSTIQPESIKQQRIKSNDILETGFTDELPYLDNYEMDDSSNIPPYNGNIFGRGG